MATPRELHQRGVTALNRGRHAAARRLLERAAAGLEDPDLLARIEGSLAYVLSETGEPVAAVELCHHALARKGLGDEARGVVYRQLGLIQMLRGEGDEALEAFGRAAELLEDDLARARLHLNRGNVHLQRRDLDKATEDFILAESAYRAAGDEYGAAKAMHNVGCCRMGQGDLPGALRDMGVAYPAFVAEGPVMTAMADQDRAEVLIAAGLFEDGVAALRNASAAYARRRLHQRQGEAELAQARHERDPRQTRAVARRAAGRFARAGSESWAALAGAEEVGAEEEPDPGAGVAEEGLRRGVRTGRADRAAGGARRRHRAGRVRRHGGPRRRPRRHLVGHPPA